jgi:very-short-patch-repair endonuclease
MRATGARDPGIREKDRMQAEHSTIVDELASRQHGLVTSAQAVRAMGRGRKNRWVSERRLLVTQPGVYRVAGAPQSWHQAVLAASLATDGVVSHRSAAELWGMIQPAGYVEISVQPGKRPTLNPPGIVHRIGDLHAELSVDREGMRVTDPVRTAIDLGLVLPQWSVRDAVSRGITTRLFGVAELQRLREALGRQGRNGTGVMQRVLDERLLTIGTEESLLEKRLIDLMRRHDLPLAEMQYELWHAGRFIARIDAAYPSRKIAIEVDGFASHSSPDAFQRDRTRQNRLVALGWTVLRFTWADVVQRPATVARTILDAIDRLTAA